ncbi:MAG: hypothetical protein KTR33_03560 [Gammaproteobacteria bacterium]|nr:hypothetical protein [Gammaproteobacteria bacterium]
MSQSRFRSRMLAGRASDMAGAAMQVREAMGTVGNAASQHDKCCLTFAASSLT